MSAPTSKWFTCAEIAKLALPGVEKSERGVGRQAKRDGWADPAREGVWWRKRDKYGATEFHLCVLPLAAQAKIAVDLSGELARVPAGAPSNETCGEMWAWFERQSEKKKAVARERLLALQAVRELTDAAVSKTVAVQQVARLKKVAPSSLYAWEKLTHRVPRSDWLAFLAPRHATQDGARAEMTQEAWDFIAADYLRPERPTIAACYRRLVRAASSHGWVVPSEKTVARKFDALPQAMVVLARDGQEALKQLYPAQERRRDHFHALEAVNADGHKWDVFVRWPDGTIGRPMMCVFQDLYSGKILSWRVDNTATKELVRLAFGDMVERFGVPDHCWLDNGRDFASHWITGGTANRYRFKVRDEAPAGIMTQLGVQVHWTNPYSGQSKPIERAFRDFAGEIAKHPAFAGAYVGHKVTAKPDNYGNRAVPLDEFLRIAGESIAEHNARTGRRSHVAQLRSFDEVFAESYAASPIRQASVSQRRLWLMAAEAVSVSRRDGSITLMGNRFWADFLGDWRGKKIAARFDPQALQDGLHVYRIDGGYLGAAPCIEAAGFNDVDAARRHAQQRKAWIKGVALQVEAERRMSIDQVAALLPRVEAAEPPAPKVVRMVNGPSLTVAASAPDEQSEDERLLIKAVRQLRLVQREGDELQ